MAPQHLGSHQGRQPGPLVRHGVAGRGGGGRGGRRERVAGVGHIIHLQHRGWLEVWIEAEVGVRAAAGQAQRRVLAQLKNVLDQVQLRVGEAGQAEGVALEEGDGVVKAGGAGGGGGGGPDPGARDAYLSSE